MPGDKIQIEQSHIDKAETIYPVLRSLLPDRKAVVCVCGGSGVGKSEIASLLAGLLREDGIKAYVMSGDNYPHRIPAENDAIVCYFSRTNNTERIASYIAELTSSSTYGIEAKVPYSDADINDNDKQSRANKEQAGPSCRPEIGSPSVDLAKINLVYLGYPIWWGQAPKIMYTFLESYDFEGKTIVPFCTSGSSPIGSSATNLSTSASKATWKEGKRFSASSGKDEAKSWLETL
jgi:flavodoxin